MERLATLRQATRLEFCFLVGASGSNPVENGRYPPRVALVLHIYAAHQGGQVLVLRCCVVLEDP